MGTGTDGTGGNKRVSSMQRTTVCSSGGHTGPAWRHEARPRLPRAASVAVRGRRGLQRDPNQVDASPH